jgi:hypothetical protein
MKHSFFVASFLLAAFSIPAAAEDAYYQVDVNALKITEGTLPREAESDSMSLTRVRVVLDGQGEAYLLQAGRAIVAGNWGGSVVARAPAGKDVSGRLFVPKADKSGEVMVKFAIPAASASADGRAKFLTAKEEHYQALLDRNIAGAAWFRHQVHETKLEAADPRAVTAAPLNPRRFRGNDDLIDTYALFTGGRALSENLQLDRVLAPAKEGAKTVDVKTLRGITVREMDWTALIKDVKVDPDALAKCLPVDQHAVCFPSFKAMTRVMDEADANGTPVLNLIEPRSESADTRETYQTQLCLSVDALSRLLGPAVINSVAITGSDPYLRTGTDMAVLFEAKDPTILMANFTAKQDAAMKADPEVKAVKGDVQGVSYRGVVSPDRRVSSYLASNDKVIVVTNSLAQLTKLVAVWKGQSPALASLPEYMFFRNRYPRGEQETAFLILTDATIRRWCGPEWRIATSRRTRAQAAMAEIQAANMPSLVPGAVKEGQAKTDLPVDDLGALSISKRGVSSSVYGNMRFLTPIIELDVTQVSEAEAAAYNNFRDRYQNDWNRYFDPIAAQVSIRDDRLDLDLSVMPLIAGTEYRDMIDLTQGAQIKPGAGDPHPESLIHFIMSINRQSRVLQMGAGPIARMAPGLADPLGWLGSSAEIYLDKSPFWKELAEAKEPEKFMEANFARAPVALRIEVSSALKVTAFLVCLRGLVEQSAPEMTIWDDLKHSDRPYVRVTPSAKMVEDEKHLENLAVYYAVTANSLLITLNEDLMKRALDRQVARTKARLEQPPKAPPAEQTWPGENFAVAVDKSFVDVAMAVTRKDYHAAIQARSWANLAILNEWKRLYPDKDPLEVHRSIWHMSLLCPGGGDYKWNEEYATMESTVYGHPGKPIAGSFAPKALENVTGGRLGLTFKDQGLRARVEISRKAGK